MLSVKALQLRYKPRRYCCRFDLVLELSVEMRIDLPGRILAMDFEQNSNYYRVEVYRSA